jgi:hypothetical protein
MAGEKGFDYAAPMSGFFQEVQKTLVQQSDYRGMRGHDVKTHEPHGTHFQHVNEEYLSRLL